MKVLILVFILAGQSHMAGKALAGMLEAAIADPERHDQFEHLNTGGQWTMGPEVWVTFLDQAAKGAADQPPSYGPRWQGMVRGAALAAWLAAAASAAAAQESHGARLEEARTPQVRFDPVVRDIEGWTVYIEPALLNGDHQEEGRQALAMLANHLQRIKILVPADRLEKLQAVGIWIEHAHPQLGAMQYHPSRQWLVSHGYDPRLARMVHITHAGALLSRQQMLKHPAVVLHELAHAYHDQVLGFDHPEIIAAYNKAKASGSYEKVLLYTGKYVRHYGMTDHKEYFAEGTEAFFYRNDFYPFVRAELKEHDPTLYAVLKRIWEDP